VVFLSISMRTPALLRFLVVFLGISRRVLATLTEVSRGFPQYF
jgi:hypothetical protein